MLRIKQICLISLVLPLCFVCYVHSTVAASEIVIVPTGTDDDTDLIQAALDGLQDGDTLRLIGDFVHRRTIYLGSNFTWILEGTLTLAPNCADNLDDYGLRYPGFDNSRSTAIATREGAINIDMSGGTIYGNGDLNGEATGLPRVRQLNCVFAEDCYFHDMVIEDASDDCFTLGAASHHNIVERVIGRHAGGRVEKIGGNALTDVGHHNIWIDCIADQGGSDGWTPKCQYSTFIRCIAANNNGPGFGMYAREEGYAGNEDVGAHIIGNQFIDCVAYGSKRGSGFSFNISSNCPGAIIRDNYIQAVCYDNQKSGVDFRNKDDAETGIIEDNVVDIVCYGNKGLNNSGSINSWAGGLGMENDNSSTHNTIDNITGSVVCYDNSVDVNTKGGQNCNITVYHPEGENDPVLVDTSSYNNTVTVIDFNCSDPLIEWCMQAYCPDPPAAATNPLPIDGATGVSVSTELSWTGGAGVATHTVYFSTNSDPNNDPNVSSGLPAIMYDPPLLALGTTYFWQIDEVNSNGTTAGVVWYFTTAPAANFKEFATVAENWSDPSGLDELVSLSVAWLTTQWSAPDITPPDPNIATFDIAPIATDSTTITMTATTGSDVSNPVEYFFDETSGIAGGSDSLWQISPLYIDDGLTAELTYTYTVTMRDAVGNVGGTSGPQNATTPLIIGVVEENDNQNDTVDVKNGQKGAQSFSHSNAFWITSIELLVSAETGPSPDQDLEFSIGAGVNGSTVFSSDKTIASGSITGSLSTVTVTYEPAIGPFSASTDYHLNFEVASGNGKAYFLGYNGDSDYSDGTYYKGGSNDGKDMYFKVFGYDD